MTGQAVKGQREKRTEGGERRTEISRKPESVEEKPLKGFSNSHGGFLSDFMVLEEFWFPLCSAAAPVH